MDAPTERPQREDEQLLQEGRLARASAPWRVVLLVGLAAVVVAAAVAVVLVLVFVVLPGEAASVPAWPREIPWVACDRWLNGTSGGFARAEDGRYNGGCAQLTLCAAPAGALGYRGDDTGCARGPGPLLRLKPGVTYGLIFCVDSDVGAPSNVHTHGLHISGSGNADDVTRRAAPGECIFYEYRIPASQMGGFHWYHAHVHGSTEAQVKAVGRGSECQCTYHCQQVLAGAWGLIVVEDQSPERLFASYSASQLQDAYNLLTAQQHQLLLVAEYNVTQRSWSNAYAPDYHLRARAWYRMRVLTVNVKGVLNMVQFPPTCRVLLIAHDGVYRFRVPGPEVSEFSMTGASRLDVALLCNSTGTISVGGAVVATLHVLDTGAAPARASPFSTSGEAWLSWRPPYLPDLRHADCAECTRMGVVITDTAVNDVSWTSRCPFKTAAGENWAFGSLNEWQLNATRTHPFHLHLYHQQIVSPGGCGADYDEGECASCACREGVFLFFPPPLTSAVFVCQTTTPLPHRRARVWCASSPSPTALVLCCTATCSSTRTRGPWGGFWSPVNAHPRRRAVRWIAPARLRVTTSPPTSATPQWLRRWCTITTKHHQR